MKLSSLVAGTVVIALSACGGGMQTTPSPIGGGATESAPSQASPVMQTPQENAPAKMLQPSAASLGLWPRSGPSKRVCPNVSNGYARCQAWIRTDVRGLLRQSTPAGYSPSDLQTAYGLTTFSQGNGDGQTVAIVDAFDDPKAASDLGVYRAQFGLPACGTTDACFTKVKLGTRTNTGWAEEESLDVDMVSAICPNCKIILVEAATNSTANLAAAEKYATAHAGYVSNSWSGKEGTKTYDADFNVSGIAITAATGDNGHNATAQWPAILPSVTAVGGTTLSTYNPRAESAWSGAGSGCSKIYAKPSFQSGINTGCTKRAEADTSADANPNTGVAVYDTDGNVGGWLVFGGTSVATPIIASVFALGGKTANNNDAFLYSQAANLNDVTTGKNGSCGAPLCTAGKGWDGPTGLGTPNGIGAF